MNGDSIFQSVLGSDWGHLGSIIRRHYFLKPHSTDSICVSGEMYEIYHSTVAKLLIPAGLLFGAIVPYKGKHIPVDVYYSSSPDTVKKLLKSENLIKTTAVHTSKALNIIF